MKVEKQIAGNQPGTGKKKKALIWIMFGGLTLFLVIILMASAKGGKKEPLNMEVPSPNRKQMDNNDSLSVSKVRSYEEEDRQKRKREGEEASPLNLDLVPVGPDRGTVEWNGGNDVVDSSVVHEPPLKDQLRQSENEFFSPDTMYGYKEPENKENVVYVNPHRSNGNEIVEKEKEGFSSVSFDNRGLPVSQTVDGQMVQVKQQVNEKEVSGNVLQSSGGDVFSDKQNITGSIMRQQEIYSGSLVKIRLEEAIKVNGVYVPKNTVVTGRAMIQKSRIEVSVPSIYVAGIVYDIGFQVYDQDGVIGLFIPDEVGIRQAKEENIKSSANQALSQEVQQSTQDLGTAEGKAGIIQRTGRTIASIVTTRRKLLKVNVPEGYKILLRPSCETCRN